MTLLAQALRQGIQLLYREALIEAYVLGQLCRKQVVPEIGLEALDEIDYQRDTLQWDVHWGSPPRVDLGTLTRGAYKDRLIGTDSDGRVSNMTTNCYIKHFIYWRDSDGTQRDRIRRRDSR